ncbi:short-chain dehydrogenase [Caulobacter sp. CCUG 60055]|uniref:SDR family NAD(P)-dependent oxidoreductase n=1 Tax=Caulobacter sp. CCUG 60055 TaxID=2100090 RepID=UPI001FA71F06|nr:SDR family NAD(P)-dependent oxidoreductase [Caulobacter sp. CCUG 60055]MBQ1540709.1 SDR family NAD(P)-dependent oxidoreductase [Caulobacteraceae bacterium]MCI3178952.1 short-chain dehydrogenase [Caulobacter sp. CCUG 60055]
MDKPLTGQVAFVTGASSGLGRRFAHVLADAGAAVALAARRTERLDKEAAAIAGRGGRAMAVALDVADVGAIGPALDRVQAELGPLSILINNAGVGGEGMALDLSPEAFDQTFAVNVRGVYFAAREAARRMIDSGVAGEGRARIVNIASIAAETVLPGLTAYCASKAAVAMMTKGLAREWARSGVAVNAICPGYIETEINSDWFHTEGGQKQIKGFPRRRLMDENALDAALTMLAGPAARFITGTLVTVDDGQSL